LSSAKDSSGRSTPRASRRSSASAEAGSEGTAASSRSRDDACTP
jgi:hypothetical protein